MVELVLSCLCFVLMYGSSYWVSVHGRLQRFPALALSSCFIILLIWCCSTVFNLLRCLSECLLGLCMRFISIPSTFRAISALSEHVRELFEHLACILIKLRGNLLALLIPFISAWIYTHILLSIRRTSFSLLCCCVLTTSIVSILCGWSAFLSLLID